MSIETHLVLASGKLVLQKNSSTAHIEDLLVLPLGGGSPSLGQRSGKFRFFKVVLKDSPIELSSMVLTGRLKLKANV